MGRNLFVVVVLSLSTAANAATGVPTASQVILRDLDPVSPAAPDAWLAQATQGLEAPTIDGQGLAHYRGWSIVYGVMTGVALAVGGLYGKKAYDYQGPIKRRNAWIIAGAHGVAAGLFVWRGLVHYWRYGELKPRHAEYLASQRHSRPAPVAAAAPAAHDHEHDPAGAHGSDAVAKLAAPCSADADCTAGGRCEAGACIGGSTAETFIIEGGVFDEHTRSPIDEATITISSDKETKLAVDQQTAMFKTFPIKAGAGVVTVHVEAPNYHSDERSLPANHGKPLVQMLFKLRSKTKKVKGSVRGHTRNARTGKPLRATVTVAKTDVNVMALDNGRWGIQLEPGKYKLTISLKGFRPQKRVVTITADESVVLNIDLVPRR